LADDAPINWFDKHDLKAFTERLGADIIWSKDKSGPSLYDVIYTNALLTSWTAGWELGLTGGFGSAAGSGVKAAATGEWATGADLLKAVQTLKARGMSEEAAVQYIKEMDARFGNSMTTLERIETLRSHMLRSKDAVESIIE